MNKELHFKSGTDAQLTPLSILDDVGLFFDGCIDLDPCADETRNVPAITHFTAEDDGLVRPWHGDVFVNPPYSSPRGVRGAIVPALYA